MLILWRHPDRATATFSKGKIIECSEREIVLTFCIANKGFASTQAMFVQPELKRKPESYETSL